MTTIVTGAALGIGRATTELLLAKGERVVGVDRDIAPLAELASTSSFTAIEGDVVDEATIERACAAAGEVSGLVVSAGISRPGPSDAYPLDDWTRLIDINLSAVFLAMRQAARHAVPGASFVAISSISGLQGFAGRAAYSASKAGVDGLVRSLAVEYAPRLRVNAVAPGYVMTDLVRRNLANGVISEGAILGRTPLARWGTPEDIARAIDFLLSDSSSWITGATLPVDGGWTSYGLGMGTDA